eukprot:6105175-Lingulodinium_polyedra.AAC.1
MRPCRSRDREINRRALPGVGEGNGYVPSGDPQVASLSIRWVTGGEPARRLEREQRHSRVASARRTMRVSRKGRESARVTERK